MKNRPKRRGAGQRAAKLRAEAADLSDSEGDDEFLDSDFDDASDGFKEKKTSLKMTSKRPTKRQKTRTSASDEVETSAAFRSLPKGKSKQQGKLSLLPTMPLDILFAIFSLLDPKDVLNLARTSRTIRDLLMSRQAITVWKAARANVEAPECPTIISEAHWASLLFGHVCQSCGAKNIKRACFTLLRWTCKTCRVSHLVSTTKVKKEYRNLDETALELIPYLLKRSSSHKWYWDDDLNMIAEKMASFHVDIRKGVPGAQKAFHDFKKSRKTAVVKLPLHEEDWEQFEYDYQARLANRDFDLGNKRLERITHRFQELGYKPEDLQCLRSNSLCTKQAELTDRAWQMLKDDVEADILHYRGMRLESGAQGRTRRERRRLINTRYEEYRRQHVHPSKWKYLPVVLDISYFEPFAKHVNASLNIEVTTEIFDEAFKLLPELLEDYNANLRKELLDLLPGVKKNGKGKSRASSSSASDPLELAHSVFECRRCVYRRTTLVGWDYIASHHCLREDSGLHDIPGAFNNDRQLVYNPRASAWVDQIIELAKLNPATTTIDDLDEPDLRFGCGCHSSWRSSTIPGYEWRALIHHLVTQENNPSHSKNPQLFVLSDAQTEEIKNQEEAHSKPMTMSSAWICGHCAEYDPSSHKDRATVAIHAKETHHVEDPEDGLDLFYFSRGAPDFYTATVCQESRPSTAATTSTTAKRQKSEKLFFCLRCIDTVTYSRSRRDRVYNLEEVQTHLLSKHQVPSAEENVDFSEQQRIERIRASEQSWSGGCC